MPRPKQHKQPVVLSFQIDVDTFESVKDIMKETECFNKSEVARDIFLLGLKALQEKQSK